MNTKRYLLASLAAGVFVFFYGFVVNAVLLPAFWESQSPVGLMRPAGEEIMWAIAVSCLLQGSALGWIFIRGHENRGVGEGVRFGLLIAWFVGAIYLLFYAIQPWGGVSTAVSIVVDGIMYVGAGVVLALLYKSK